ncbi:family 16 glycosylhydrolase [Cytophagales bacterium LB-30]|uniref:Family 16 glycosylhydrolase n=1 Tax=Shiella aurantiaca TaxID=3058365 RepID=A0ABT8F915_9BACT|nr:family 16 glycosylhydrolase [Shiella aurantiaca]MDN4166691.1 family 16 glycosylhydrolase [Shiella aurantiaca]
MSLSLRFLFVSTLFMLAQLSARAQCERLVWSDEFEGTGLPNSQYWGYDLGQNGWGNNEVQNYTNTTNNVRQENGLLVIEAKKSGSTWTSARVKTQAKFNFTYGRIAFRAKLPQGSGTWPALWMLGENINTVGWPACGEIDVMEHVGRDPGRIHSTLHTPSSFGNSQNTSTKIVNDYNTNFHIYEAVWTEESIKFYIDGQIFYTYAPATKNSSTWPFNSPFFIIMNIAMGGNFGSDPQYETNGQKNGIDPALTLARMEIDYVRVYEVDANPVIEGPTAVAEGETNLVFSTTDFGDGISYNWQIPADATLVSGQNTPEIVVNWGTTDGAVQVEITGETGCSTNTSSLTVQTRIVPQGAAYTLDTFADNAISGWSSSSANDVQLTEEAAALHVTHSTYSLASFEFTSARPIDLSAYGLLKIPVEVPEGSTTPRLVVTLLDDQNRETINQTFEISPAQADGEKRIYSFNYLNWNGPDDFVAGAFKKLRIYIQSGEGEFSLHPIQWVKTGILPEAPQGLDYTINNSGIGILRWTDVLNAPTYSLYQSTTENGEYTKVGGNLSSDKNPFIPSVNRGVFYKISALNEMGESPLSAAVYITADITGINESASPEIIVYPNPSSGVFFVKSASLVNNCLLFDTKGVQQEIKWIQREDEVQIQLQNATPGLYHLRVQSAGFIKTCNVLIQ